MSFASGYARALATVVRRSAIPYGYTVTVWTSGAVLEHADRSPNVGDAFLFVAGAVAGFAVVGVLASVEGHALEPRSGDLLRTGLLQALAVGLALGAAALVALLGGLVVWPLGSFAATLVYLAVAGIELALSHRDAAPGDP